MIAQEADIEKVKLDFLLQKCFKTSKSFAYYRLPNAINAQLIIGDAVILDSIIDFSTVGPGFVVSPFKDNKSFFIHIEKTFSNINPGFSNIFYESSKEFENSNIEAGFDLQKPEHNICEKASYQTSIQKVIENIESSNLTKVVISRRKHLGSLVGEMYSLGFERLCKAYPAAFISMVYIAEKKQVWIGASPEILVSENQEGIFKTVALAGTQSAFGIDKMEIRPIDALWSHKEIEEQALVSRYIINCLKKIRVREYLEEGPKTIKAGNLLHLNTSYLIDSKQINYNNLSSVMLSLLHPTSAVCGMPKELAEVEIDNTESYDREFYSGYLGPVNLNNESHLFVNLRTLKIENSQVYAYAGGGVTEDSNPEKEWLETELKLQTIQKVFGL
jgi:isochorismate synthase